MVDKKIKVITAKLMLDDHIRGIEGVSQAMRDAGMEVIYLGICQTIDGVISAAKQEDVDVIGLSFLNGGHVEAMQRFMDRMRDLDHVLVIVGGIIPYYDIPKLKEMGVGEAFPAGTSMNEIVTYVSENIKR